MTKPDDTQQIKLAWLRAAANALEYEHNPFRAMCTGADDESTKLCVFAAVIPRSHHEHYMISMISLHERLVEQYPQLVSDRPEKAH